MWGRLKTITVVEAAIMGAWYYVTFDTEHQQSAISFLVAAIGLFLSFICYRLIRIDCKKRDWYRDQIKQANEEFEDSEINEAKWTLAPQTPTCCGDSWCFMRPFENGIMIFKITGRFFIVANFVMLCCSWCLICG